MKKQLPHDDDLLNNLQCLYPSKQGTEVMRLHLAILKKLKIK